MSESLRDELAENYPEMVLFDGLDRAILGVSGHDEDAVAVYGFEAMVKVFVDDQDWSEEEAIEWINFNVLPLQVGPIVIYEV